MIPNLYPFTKNHEIIIHSQDHDKNFDRLPFEQVVKIIQVYKDRYTAHQKSGPARNASDAGGQVYIFHNHGSASGESLMHPHSQLVVVPFAIHLDTPHLRIPEDVLGEQTISSFLSGDFSVA